MTERRSRAEIVRLGNRYLEMMAGGDSASDVAARYSVPTWRLWADVNVARAERVNPTVDALPEPVWPVNRLWNKLTAGDIRMLHAIRDEIKAADAMARENR